MYIVYYSVECIYNRPDVPPAVKALFVAILYVSLWAENFDEETLATLRANEKEIEPGVMDSLIKSKLAEWMKMKEAGVV